MGNLINICKKIIGKWLSVFNNLKIRYKLVASYFLITVIPVSAIGILSYNSTLSYIKTQDIKIMTNMQKEYNINVTNRLSRYMNLADVVYFNPKIQMYLDSEYPDYYNEYDFVNNYMSPVINPLLETTGKGINLDIVRYGNQNNEIMNNYLHALSEYPIGSDNNDIEAGKKNFNIYNEKRIEKKDWYRQVKDKIVDYRWAQIDEDAQNKRITLIRPLESFLNYEKKPLGFLLITVRMEDILGKSSVNLSNGDGFHIVFDKDNKVLSIEDNKLDFYNKHKNELNHYLAAEERGSSLFMDNYIVIKGTNELTGWRILSINSIETLNDSIKVTRNMTIIYCIAAVIVLFIVTYLISTSFSKRITKISDKMNIFQNGNFESTVEDVHNDEIGYLARAFNEMASRIGSLIRDNYQANLDKKEAQLKALQAQINPHFLYNSLSSISGLASMMDLQNVNIMVKSLTTFYRMSLSGGKDIIRIPDELEQVKAYIEIYRVRKGDDFSVVYDIDKEVMGYYTVKVILQPFVENILEHAMYRRESPITIIISAKPVGGDILFKIIDDGVGVRPERIKDIFLRDTTNGKGYGIKNVDARIKLHFGNQYGIKIDSRPGIGTTVSIRIPRHRV